MTHRNNPRRAMLDGQLLFDWSAGNFNDIQLLEAQVSSTTPIPPGHEIASDRSLTATASDPAVSDVEPVERRGYGPGHPWHYLPDGDNAAPLPFDDIPPAEDYGRSLERELPRPAAKRIIKARALLAEERRDLEQAGTRYEEVISRGADALSRYDREIAYGGNDELARVGTLALLYSQISWRRGRIAYLEQLASLGLTRSR